MSRNDGVQVRAKKGFTAVVSYNPSNNLAMRDLEDSVADRFIHYHYRELAGEGFVETRHGAGTFVKEVSSGRKAEEKKIRAEEMVRKMLEEGARLGIKAGELAQAFQDEVGSKANE